MTSTRPHSPVAPAQALDPLCFPLQGCQLIEASAGTGKTWTIAALYLRLVLGHGRAPGQGFARPLRPDEILVMTFTRAATRELSDRIRARLLEAAQAFRASLPDAPPELCPAPPDELLRGLLADYPEVAERQQAAWRLALAAEGMDDAAIHTIDAWCQRMLREHAFDSGSLFDDTLVPDESDLLVEAVQDYWRQQSYPLTPAALGRLRAVWSGVDALLRDMRTLLPLEPRGGNGTGPASSVADLLLARARQLAPLLAGGSAQVASMAAWLQREMGANPKHWSGTTFKPAQVAEWLARLADWVVQPDPLELPDLGKGVQRLTPAGLQSVRNKTAPPLPELPPAFAWWARLVEALEALPSLASELRQHAAAQVAHRLDVLKRQRSQLGFADLLIRLDRALAGPNGRRLRERLLRQTPVALVDEFQDTSALQFQLFDRLYQVTGGEPVAGSLLDADTAQLPTALLLIGDPKQSIYRFRGADIGSYLAARRATQGHHHVLATNHRSTQALVDAVNHGFVRAERRPGSGAFGYRAGAPAQGEEPADNPLPFIPVGARGRPERLVAGGEPLAPLTLVHDLQLANGESHLRRFAEQAAEQIVLWLNDPATGFETPGDEAAGAPLFRRLRPADVAVLVRTGREARAIRQALRRREVASVYLSDRDSVLASDEAGDLLRWLRAVAEPLDTRLARAAWATRTMGLSLDELAAMADDESGSFETRSSQLLALSRVWQTQGVLTLLRQTLHQFGLAARWLRQPDGERRLTNYLHLAELLQTASRGLDGEQALIRWLDEQLQSDQGAAGDEQIVRLESDADLVKVVTIHKSKGLEYPVVLLPFPVHFRAVNRGNTPYVLRPTATGELQLDLQPDAEALAWADAERMREDLRLLYVALTRARHALWLGFPALKVGNAAACQNHRSALGRLLGGEDERSPQGWAEVLADWAEDCAGIRLQALPGMEALTPLQPGEVSATLREAPVYQASFDRRWSIASFSGLVRDAGSGISEASPPLPPQPRSPRPADDEVAAITAAASVEADRANNLRLRGAQMEQGTPPLVWHRFERGALAGNFLHDQLEWLAGEHFQLETGNGLAQRLALRCERAGRAAQAPEVVDWLTAVVQVSLPGPGAALAALDRVLPEMEFWLPAAQLPADRIDALCCTHLPQWPARPALPARQLHGMLMGFADLVIEHQGRFWVLDYKSNQLGPDGAAYDAAALGAAMAAHRYDVQAALYLLALHRLLRGRLGAAYQPQQHLGGALYLFLRGIDGPERGVVQMTPPWDLLASLDDLLAGEPCHD